MTEAENQGTQAARPTFGQRVFLGQDGRVRPIWRALVFMVLSIFLIAVVNVAVRAFLHAAFPEYLKSLPKGGLPPLRVLSLGYVLTNTVLLLLSWLLLATLDRRSFRALGLWFYSGWGRELLQGIGIGAGLQVAIAGALLITRGVSYHGLAGGGSRGLLGILGIGGLLVLAAAFEEILTRGYGFQRLVDSITPLGAVLVFSALFGAAHLGNPNVTALSTANAVLAGVMLAVAYLKTRALWLPIGLHWAWNFTMGAVFSLPVSGLKPAPALLSADITGAKWWTGGPYGPEGGVVVTVVSLAAILWLARTRKVAPSPAMEEVLK